MFLGWRGFFGGNPGPENLDRPISNFDVIGIPNDRWSSGFCDCFSNIVPSCFLSFFCPCIMWGQIVTRAQIPLLIGIKNSLFCLRRKTGYGFFVDLYFWTAIITVGLMLTLILVDIKSGQLWWFLLIVILVCGGIHWYVTGHSLTAFKEKYRLPGLLPPGCQFWDMILDCFVIEFCFPCQLSRMARHVFQYDRMDAKVGLFLGDPSTLPPLRPLDIERGDFDRPARADEAGLVWTHDGHHPGVRDNTGAAHRQEELLARQRQQLRQGTPTQQPAVAVAVAVPVQ